MSQLLLEYHQLFFGKQSLSIVTCRSPTVFLASACTSKNTGFLHNENKLHKHVLSPQTDGLLFLPNYTQSFIFLTDFSRNPEHKISRKDVKWELNFSMQTDEHDKTNNHFSQFFCKCTKDLWFHGCPHWHNIHTRCNKNWQSGLKVQTG